MALVIGIVIGVLMGAGLVYLWMSNSLSAKTQELDQANRALKDLQRNHESRLRAATEALRSDFQRKLDQKQANAGESGAGESAPPRTTTIQTNRQTKIQSHTEEPSDSELSDSPQQDSPQTDSSQLDSSQPDSSPPTDAQPTDMPTADSPVPTLNATELSVPESPPADAPAPLLEATQSEISFVRSGLTDTQRQDLMRVISNMGQSKQPSHLPELQRLALFSSSDVRQAVAIAISSIASANSTTPAIRQTVPLLGKLSQDPDSTVRFAAVEGLGAIQSSRVIPYVRRLLRDPDMKVVGAAKTVMDRFKYYPSTPSLSKQTKKKSYRSTSSKAD